MELAQYTSYVMVNSNQRQKKPTINYHEDIYNLPAYPLKFTHGSSIVTINTHIKNIEIGDTIALSNITSKNLFLKNILSVKKNSSYLRIMHSHHGLSYHNLYTPTDDNAFVAVDYVDILPGNYSKDQNIPDTAQSYYILRSRPFPINIKLGNVKGIGNIPANYINSTHEIYLLFTKTGTIYTVDRNNYLIRLRKKSSINYMDGVNLVSDKVSENTAYIRYNTLYGISVNYLNSKPFTVTSINSNSIQIDIKYKAVVDPIEPFYHMDDAGSDTGFNYVSVVSNQLGGGSQSLLRKILSISPVYPDPNEYSYVLDKTFKNVSSIRITASSFPNSQKTVRQKLYWRNLDDGDDVYQIDLVPGNYSPYALAKQIEEQARGIVRYNDTFNILQVEINPDTSLVNIASYNEIYLNHTSLTIPDNLVHFILDTPIENSLILVYQTATIHGSVNLNLYSGRSIVDDNHTIVEGHLVTDTITILDISDTVQISINSRTVLTRAFFERLSNTVYLTNHQLAVGSIIITDRFENKVNLYEVVSVVSSHKITVKISTNYQFIYDDIFIGSSFETRPKIVDIIPQSTYKPILNIHHPNHNLSKGDEITIYFAKSINQVPDHIINKTHRISRILSEEYYQIILPDHQPNLFITSSDHMVKIRYPNLFQLLFNYPDTIGAILGFNDVGEDHAITPYQHTIKNTDPYLEEVEIYPVGKNVLSMTGFDYFYICSPELSLMRNTNPVSNVFTTVQWTSNPGKVVFNSYTPVIKKFEEPLDSLSIIHFEMRNPDGTLVEFNGMDHSFTLEIVENFTHLTSSSISARLGMTV